MDLSGMNWLDSVRRSRSMRKELQIFADIINTKYPPGPQKTVIILNSPSVFITMFNALKTMGLFTKEVLDTVQFLRSSNLHDELDKFVSKENRLAEHGDGKYIFEVEEFLSVRAGIDGCSLCGDVADIQENASHHLQRSARDGDSSKDPEDRDSSFSAHEASQMACMSGMLWKRGSGSFLGSTRWQEKFFALVEDTLLYYDNAAASQPKRAINLGIDTIVTKPKKVNGMGEKYFALNIWTPGREYELASALVDDRDAWADLIISRS
ncbi:hypothetical protein CYMTET_52824 [Cymbomonas tetramitiformis]|uniref:Uncharacterized protein n=1 Tax=Cymbomonas tetramitiformis TaxID=36881 RepID=A0AAE0BIH2_9CHLO|nr:hypothetical protein CYMTET_52824 [Cymbomonas tetramitiformis]